MSHQCPRINTMSLTYTSPKLTARLSNCNDTVLGDLMTDPVEIVLANRNAVRNVFIVQHLISKGCVEHCHAVSRMRMAGWKREGEL